jgi:hypothetical protein
MHLLDQYESAPLKQTLPIILLFGFWFPFNEARSDDEYHCPLTAGYLAEQLSAMEALPLYPTAEQVAPLMEHATRMAAETLKNEDVFSLDSCDYFRISLRLEGLEKGLEEYRKQFAAYNIAELLTEVEKCGRWVAETFENRDAQIESYFCR